MTTNQQIKTPMGQVTTYQFAQSCTKNQPNQKPKTHKRTDKQQAKRTVPLTCSALPKKTNIKEVKVKKSDDEHWLKTTRDADQC